MARIHTIQVIPPLVNSSCAWASDIAQLRDLYRSPCLGGITTRTATLNGFDQNESHTVRMVRIHNGRPIAHVWTYRLSFLIRQQHR